MEQQSENLHISTSTNEEKSLLTGKSLRNTPTRRNTKHNWAQLRVEYLTGNIIDVTEFGRMHEINENTLNKNTHGWREEYLLRQDKLADETLKRIGKKSVGAMLRKAHAGRLILTKSIREFSKRNLIGVESKELVQMAKIGAELESPMESTTNQLNVQVNNGIVIDEATARAIREMADRYATGAGIIREIQPMVLGEQAHQESGQ